LRKFNVKIDSAGLLLTIKGKTIRTPVTILSLESELKLIKMQLKNANVSYSIEEVFAKSDDIIIETMDLDKNEENTIEEKHKEIDIEELNLKYETLLSKMMKESD
jgi:hypothetical protein